jgi:DNA-binding GntR family transcriptional regulator
MAESGSARAQVAAAAADDLRASGQHSLATVYPMEKTRPAPADDRLAFSNTGIARRGLRDHVYDSILDMLLRNNPTPGTRLSIDTIARQLGVSPTPVREALVDLERTGLVTREALKGYRVAPLISAEQLTELFEAREMLEATAVRLAVADVDALLPELRAAQERHRLAGEAVIDLYRRGESDVGVASDYFARDSDFHAVILEHSGNRYLREMSTGLGAQLHRLRQSVHRGVTDVSEAIDEHMAIIDAFSSGDPAAAVEAMTTHIRNVRARALHDQDPTDS